MKEDKFIDLDAEAIKGLSEEDRVLYHKALQDNRLEKEVALANQIKELQKDKEANREAIDALKLELNGIDAVTIKELMQAVTVQGEALKKLREEGQMSGSSFKKELKKAYDTNLAPLQAAMKAKTGYSFDVAKATQAYGDITSGSDLAEIRQGITNLPVRMPKLRSMFKKTPISTEYYKYLEQETVVRDAQNVAKCSAITSTTKETVIVRSMQTEKVKDIIKFCLDFIADYPFMESRIRTLVDQSLALQIDAQLLAGTGVAPQLNSIGSTASEFSAANPVAVVTAAIQAANYVDLILAMQTQIIALGLQAGFDPDTVLVNKVDWFLNVESLKDTNNRYLDSRVTIVNGMPNINGMSVVWMTNVTQNTCSVFDSTKAEIIDRNVLTVEIATENGTDWESEIASMKAFERLNFWVPNNWKNAFMKCSDVTTAIAAITKP